MKRRKKECKERLGSMEKKKETKEGVVVWFEREQGDGGRCLLIRENRGTLNFNTIKQSI